jgi:peptide/nickel transport system permease protein
MGMAVLGFSIPVFWLGFLMIWVFALNLHVLPAGGYVRIFEEFGPFITRLILPALSAAVVLVALLTRITRASVIEVLQEDYVRTARAKGLTNRTVLWRHALSNASLPIITVIGLGFAGLLTGIVVVEVVFAVPGLGRLLADAISARDYPIIQGLILFLSAVYILVNLAVDLAYAFLDPRIRY